MIAPTMTFETMAKNPRDHDSSSDNATSKRWSFLPSTSDNASR